MKLRVYYEDTDAGGVVYHSNYLKFCERARSELFFSKGITPVIDGAHFVVRKMECDFKKSALFADLLEVTTEVKQMKRASFTIYHEIKKDNEVLFSANVLLVLVKNNRALKLTKDIQNLLNSLFY